MATSKKPTPAVLARPSATLAVVKVPTTVRSRPDLQRINDPKTNQGKNELFKKGGDTMAKSDMKEDMDMDKSQDKAMIKKAFKQHDMQEHKGGKGTSLKLAKGGSFRSSANGIAQRGKTRGKMC